jgi:Tfp pilus assembly protein PilN
MNAVNLIPLESRRGEALSLPGAQFLGLIAALVIALAGTVLYVGERNQVATRRSELAHVQVATGEWTAAAARYAPAVSALKQHAERFVQLGALLGERANWALLFSQLAGVMPAQSQLTSLSASGASSSAATSATGGSGGPGITISGCAATQPVVADTMIALRRLSGVSQVSLASSSLRAPGSGSGSGGAGTCTLPVQFNLALQFTPPTDLVRLLEGTRAASATAPGSATAPASSTTSQAASTPVSAGVTR